VRSALEEDPEAARLPLMQPRFEWPLCAAIRLGCSEDIVMLLTQNGAKVDVTDEKGQSPLQLLSSGVTRKIVRAIHTDCPEIIPGTTEWAEWMRESTAQFEVCVAMVLLIAGADPEACHGDPRGEQRSSLELGRRAGKDHLVSLYAQSPYAQKKGVVLERD